MTDVIQPGGAARLSDVQATYMAQVSKRRLYSGITLLVFILLMVSGFRLAEARNGGSFIGGLDNFFDYPGEVVAEAVEKAGELPAHFVTFFPALLETVNIAAVSTLVGALAAVVLSLLSTRGLARFPRLVPVFRRIMDVTRAVPEIVIALILIFVLGGGPVPAMIAIAFHTAGALGKLFSEVNENASLKPLEGLESVGATWSQRMMLGVVPQVAPNWLSYALMRFEINIRASAILGFVGAGGLGYELKNAISWGQGQYDEAAAMFLMLFATIVLFDQLSSHFRDRLVHGRKVEMHR
ncbi:phosphonate ABC transporter, permease protein PhnE [Roseovarius atlanticus]|uniref:phosphonate ABC transporter, permease protein PhnE n=1 Tax=Roseovarius atlanticus TaxID=1641875 RepID=UPI001C981625|nr:phosphonate ABC transporter, permease protein PhnE [Roseovarius atlanticus]MBY5990037.1 phosphonate ABC transporter, permease protein PhnE [Roseovarius atlanticus]MBY6126582.1 phosphonate ABC transporter, permease protein PhnE [Roseovarius atlanticus]MBY6151076.1 phosphonate ABC transporter, permease protein PhnE [Roseovarius atlanticus]